MLEISESGRAKSGLLLSYPQPPLHVGFQLGTQRFPAVWLDTVPEKPHQIAHALGRGRKIFVRGLGKGRKQVSRPEAYFCSEATASWTSSPPCAPVPSSNVSS